MGIVDLDVVLDRPGVGHTAGTEIVDGDGLVQRLDVAGMRTDQVDLERHGHGLAIRARAVGEGLVLRPGVRSWDLIELDLSIHAEMAVAVVDDLNDVGAPACGRGELPAIS